MPDIRNEPCIIITDTYTKSGQHVRTVLTTEDGTILEEYGPIPSKDVVLAASPLYEKWQKIMESR